MSTPSDQLSGGDGVPGSVLDLDAEFLNSHELNSILDSEPPLDPDAGAGDAGAGVKPGAGTEGAGGAAAKTGQAGAKGAEAAGGDKGKVEDDLELDDEDRVAQKLSDEDKPIFEKTRKAANFMSHFKAGTVDLNVLKEASPGRYGEFAGKVIRDRATADPKRFVAEDLDDETYGKVYAACVEANPMWVVEKLTGRKDLTLAGLRDLVAGNGAVESTQVKSVLDSMPNLDELKDADGETASLEELALDWPEVADFLKALKLATSDQLPKTFTSKLTAAEERAQKAEEELAKLKGGGKPDAQASKNGDEAGQGAELSPEAITARQAVESDLSDYVESHAKDKDGLNLDVSDAERAASPEVADLKETFLENWIAGSPKKGIPTFQQGLIQHFKGNAKFVEAAKQVAYYANRGETENAKTEAQKIRKYIDAYRKVRLELPYFQTLSRLVAMHSKNASKVPRVEKVIAGGGSQTSSLGSGVEESDEDILNSFGIDG